MAVVHQMLPNFSYGDAIGDDTRALQKILRESGHESDIFAGVIHPYLVESANSWTEYRDISSPDNVILYHFSVGSPINRYLLEIPDRIVLIFHNITPAHWFYGINAHMTEAVKNGYDQLVELKDRVEVAWADSEYNKRILLDIGFKNVRVLPIIIDFNKFNIPPCPVFTRQYRSNLTTLLFAGRFSPNKCQEDVVKAYAAYKKHINPKSRLFLVGETRNCSRYTESIMQLIRDLRLPDVFVTGMIDDDELVAAMQMADVFICMSEHEGFCVPLLEAMTFDIPVIAFDAGAVAGTLDNAGILVQTKHPWVIAELINLLQTDEDFREKIIRRQRTRIANYRNHDFKQAVEKLLGELIG